MNRSAFPGAQFRWQLPCLTACLALLLTACQPGSPPPATATRPAAAAAPRDDDSPYTAPFAVRPSPQALSALGRQLFREPGLSASGAQACASCHDPEHAFAPANRLAVQLGGPDGRQTGFRAVPSLRYAQDTPPFNEHFFDNDGNDSEDQGPTGGFAWDGRARSAQAQAALPLLSPQEMANASPADTVRRLAASPSAAAFREVFGQATLDNPRLAWLGLRWALEVYQQEPSEFAPYSSRFDRAMRGEIQLNAAETRGLKVFEDAKRGNCASCHLSTGREGRFPAFTDRGLIALAVPRNPALPANRDSAWFDLGLCGPFREDFRTVDDYCGRFKTPSLRNVASRGVFFHNGVYRSLREVMQFYAWRDTRPERIYPRRPTGGVAWANDIPVDRRNGIQRDAPFGDEPGQAPRLNARDIDDLVAFLQTLTDADVKPLR